MHVNIETIHGILFFLLVINQANSVCINRISYNAPLLVGIDCVRVVDVTIANIVKAPVLMVALPKQTNVLLSLIREKAKLVKESLMSNKALES